MGSCGRKSLYNSSIECCSGGVDGRILSLEITYTKLREGMNNTQTRLFGKIVHRYYSTTITPTSHSHHHSLSTKQNKTFRA